MSRLGDHDNMTHTNTNTNKTTQKQVEHHNATDIQNELFLCFAKKKDQKLQVTASKMF